ncbi:head-tail adaptor protein [Streptomyces cylindrosporus]|uniref:Head-tail adaptor protein n=1 Tax=Streptomyces cylindrosporus TaxID=2927583 RepID=A0ABS9Y503_9ACTN|nr:head-tail adaptor protein [Streptomyces cylindrosporus]MCI3271021.1 head-tail adaptor protein [Streptomyces cylindrosporus]
MSRVNRLLNASAEVWRSARTSDGIGGWTEGWAKASTVRARFSQPSATERAVNDRYDAKLSQIVYLRHDADVRRGDQLRTSGRTLRVLATYEPSVPGTYLRADCEDLQVSQ